MQNIFQIASELGNKGVPVALCTIVNTKGSTPLKQGAKLLVEGNGTIYGTIGGGSLEKRIIELAIASVKSKTSQLVHHDLLQQLGMCCGGSVSVFIEFIPPPNRLYIFGAGHVGRALAKYSNSLAFEVFLIDERTEELEKIDESGINKLPVAHHKILPHLPFNEYCYIAIMTHDHQLDRDILAYCLKKEAAYLGMIGSRRKVEVTKKMFRDGGWFTEDELRKVDMPMGFDLKATGPEEIAVSIIAKIVARKNAVPFELEEDIEFQLSE